jgi:hypothetical protein
MRRAWSTEDLDVWWVLTSADLEVAAVGPGSCGCSCRLRRRRKTTRRATNSKKAGTRTQSAIG